MRYMFKSSDAENFYHHKHTWFFLHQQLKYEPFHTNTSGNRISNLNFPEMTCLYISQATEPNPLIKKKVKWSEI